MPRTKGSTNKVPSKNKLLDYSVETIRDTFKFIQKNRDSFSLQQLQELQVIYEKFNNILESRSIKELKKIQKQLKEQKDETPVPKSDISISE